MRLDDDRPGTYLTKGDYVYLCAIALGCVFLILCLSVAIIPLGASHVEKPSTNLNIQEDASVDIGVIPMPIYIDPEMHIPPSPD